MPVSKPRDTQPEEQQPEAPLRRRSGFAPRDVWTTGHGLSAILGYKGNQKSNNRRRPVSMLKVIITALVILLAAAMFAALDPRP